MTTLFDLAEGEKRKREGMDRAAISRADLLEVARKAALRKGRLWFGGGVTSDDVRRSLNVMGYPDALGNAAGAIFRGPDWEFTGEWVKSKIPSNHGRMIRVWRLKC